MPKRILNHIKPKQLKAHPLNREIYGEDVPDEEFIESIRQGVQEPITITTGNVIVSGHRRWQAALKVELDTVPVVIRQDLDTDLDVQLALLHANKQREKTPEQRAREYQKLKELESEKAKKRQTSGRSNLKQNSKNSSVSPVPQNSAEPDKGEARQKAAEEVGWSHDTAEKASSVVEQIDEAEESGDTETADELRETLNNKSVSAAHEKASKKDNRPKDKAGTPIPDNLRPVFDDLAPLFRSALATHIAKVQENALLIEDELYPGERGRRNIPKGGFSAKKVLDLAGQIHKMFDAHCPRYVCQKCDGQGGGCKACKDRGWRATK